MTSDATAQPRDNDGVTGLGQREEPPLRLESDTVMVETGADLLADIEGQ